MRATEQTVLMGFIGRTFGLQEGGSENCDGNSESNGARRQEAGRRRLWRLAIFSTVRCQRWLLVGQAVPPGVSSSDVHSGGESVMDKSSMDRNDRNHPSRQGCPSRGGI
jgi:hypothetical protein